MEKHTNTNRKSDSTSLDGESVAEGARRKYLYRRMVINGQAKIPARLAMKMVGPDCAYHLYRNHHAGEDS